MRKQYLHEQKHDYTGRQLVYRFTPGNGNHATCLVYYLSLENFETLKIMF